MDENNHHYGCFPGCVSLLWSLKISLENVSGKTTIVNLPHKVHPKQFFEKSLPSTPLEKLFSSILLFRVFAQCHLIKFLFVSIA